MLKRNRYAAPGVPGRTLVESPAPATIRVYPLSVAGGMPLVREFTPPAVGSWLGGVAPGAGSGSGIDEQPASSRASSTASGAEVRGIMNLRLTGRFGRGKTGQNPGTRPA
jgi:hypothetical protein